MIASPVFSGKHYAVLGLARSGRATVEALAASGAKVMAWDERAEARGAISRDEDLVRVADPMTRWGSVVIGRLPLSGEERVLDAATRTRQLPPRVTPDYPSHGSSDLAAGLE